MVGQGTAEFSRGFERGWRWRHGSRWCVPQIRGGEPRDVLEECDIDKAGAEGWLSDGLHRSRVWFKVVRKERATSGRIGLYACDCARAAPRRVDRREGTSSSETDTRLDAERATGRAGARRAPAGGTFAGAGADDQPDHGRDGLRRLARGGLAREPARQRHVGERPIAGGGDGARRGTTAVNVGQPGARPARRSSWRRRGRLWTGIPAPAHRARRRPLRAPVRRVRGADARAVSLPARPAAAAKSNRRSILW